MKKVLLIVYTAFIIILLTNYIYYRNLYNRQIDFIVTLLNRQVQIVGFSVDNTNNNFISDMNEIIFSEDLHSFFNNEEDQQRTIEKMKLFFSKYKNFVTGIKLYDNNRNEYTLKKDETSDITDEWLEQQFVLHVQGEILDMETLRRNNRNFEYYLPVIEQNEAIGNIVVSVDYQKYFNEIFAVYNLEDYQWQWVLSDSGDLIYDNTMQQIDYSQLDIISSSIREGLVDNLIHRASINGKNRQIISSYYSTQLLQREIGLIFSAPTEFFQKYIIRNSIFIVLGTLILIQVIIYVFWRFIRTQRSEAQRLSDSEKMLFKLIEEMPVGVIIHNRSREIIKANKVAASFYSYPNEQEMKGKIFPETSIPDVGDYYARNLGAPFNPDQFVIIKKEIGELVLYRNSIPVTFMGEEAKMEILIDITMLESARKQEAKANIAKSEFLARMSYEIRTPLNGIIGMTDVINKYNLSSEVREIVALLKGSTEVLLNIINDILDFSKIETGKMILDQIPFDLKEEIGYCAELAKTYIGDKEIEFKYDIEKNVPSSIVADQYRLRQILTNLIYHSASNTDKGEINLKCSLQERKNGNITLGFDLLDTGIKFDKASLKKIFGDFVNIEAKPVKNSDESGFGTILARQLVELMGGQLIAESPSGIAGDAGTKIRFTVKTFSNDRVIKDLDHSNIKTFNDIKTLIITGPQNRDEEVLGFLHKLGLDVSVTTFQKMTVNQIKANLNSENEKYNLIVINDDAEFNGFEAARTIWENNLTNKIIILLISSNDQTGNYLKCLTLGIDHYLTKPFNINELSEVINESFPHLDNKEISSEMSDLNSDINILVVEDNTMNQIVIVKMLNTLGYSCDIAEDGYEGYNKATNLHYDLIFMDLILPEISGYDSAQKILKEDPETLIVAFSADNMPDTKRKAELSGIKEFISKPVRIEELKKIFTKHFKKS